MEKSDHVYLGVEGSRLALVTPRALPRKVIVTPASLSLAALHFSLPSHPFLAFWLLFQLFGCFFISGTNIFPYPALLVIFAMFPSLLDSNQAPTERGGAMIHDGTWPVEDFSPFPLPLLPSFSFSRFFLSFNSKLFLAARSRSPSASIPFSTWVFYYYNGRFCIPPRES